MCLAIPALVSELLPDDMAKVSLDGVTKEISLAMVEDVAVDPLVAVGGVLPVRDVVLRPASDWQRLGDRRRLQGWRPGTKMNRSHGRKILS